MPKNKKLTISIVIPVYNDAERLSVCLAAIAKLRVRPDEIIVVDNNSSDDSVAVALSYPGVIVISETRQGVVYARDAGFNRARGKLIARIDADTIVPPDWLDHVLQIFSDNQSIAAVSGSVDYYDFAFANIAQVVDRYSRYYLSRSLGKWVFLFGANMAMRRQAWLKVRNQLCHDRGMHEDLDLGIHLQDDGYKVVYDSALRAGTSSRRLNSGVMEFIRYTLVSPKTYAIHKLSERWCMYPVILMVWSLYLPARLAQKGFDPDIKRLSWKMLITNKLQVRIDPTTNIADL